MFLGSMVWMIALVLVINVLASLMIAHNPETRTRRIVHQTALSLVAVGFIAAGLYLVQRGLSPLEELRTRLARVRDGSAKRVEGTYPSEVEPLIIDLNSLLDDRERAVTRALATAGDLAHGLKTPLAVLAQEAERAAASGHNDLAALIGQQVERMRRQVDYQLAHARAAASAGTAPGIRCSVKESAEGLARTLRRLHAARGISIDTSISPELFVRCNCEDLDEMLGNLMDNACKWARSAVSIASHETPEAIEITVDDDGSGLAAEMRERVLQRGVRADEASPGSGLGLAIVGDLVQLYGGNVELREAPSGGVRVLLSLPKN